MFENLISALKAEKRTIVFTEGEDARILEAASRLKKDGLMDSILVGNVEAVKAAAAKGGCGECQTSCQSACKTSCGVANQKCENTNK